MAVSKAAFDAATNYELCIWIWVSSNEHLAVRTEDDCWMVRATGARGTDYIRIPTKDDRIPDFNHPEWPAARKALEKLRGCEA